MIPFVEWLQISCIESNKIQINRNPNRDLKNMNLQTKDKKPRKKTLGAYENMAQF